MRCEVRHHRRAESPAEKLGQRRARGFDPIAPMETWGWDGMGSAGGGDMMVLCLFIYAAAASDTLRRVQREDDGI